MYAKLGRMKESVLMPVFSEHLKWGKLNKEAKACFNNRLAKLQKKEIAKPRLVDWDLLKEYKIHRKLRKLIDVTRNMTMGLSIKMIAWK